MACRFSASLKLPTLVKPHPLPLPLRCLCLPRPTSCPFITSVGGSSGSPERVWSDGGGGFSNTYGTPDYQADAVKAYLNSGVAPASSYFNASGRAYPDVAAFATGFEIVIHGTTLGVDGTSCATPTFAGVVSALNDVRMAAGKPTLGAT